MHTSRWGLHSHIPKCFHVRVYARGRKINKLANTQLNISLLALSLTALKRMSGSGLNRFSVTSMSQCLGIYYSWHSRARSADPETAEPSCSLLAHNLKDTFFLPNSWLESVT